MTQLHITSGDVAGKSLAASGLPGEILVWRDILYDGKRKPGWPDEAALHARAEFLQQVTAGGLDRGKILATLRRQYDRLNRAGECDRLVLWFDACLFDQAMLAHILACLQARQITHAELLCVDEFPGIVPFHGLGQLRPDELSSLYVERRPVTSRQYSFAASVDAAFAAQSLSLLKKLSRASACPLPWMVPAARRWLQERPDPDTGLGRLERLALEAIRRGCQTPEDIFAYVAAADTPPQYWGDTTLWAKINGLADRHPPLLDIEGPGGRLPQWKSEAPLSEYRIRLPVDCP